MKFLGATVCLAAVCAADVQFDRSLIPSADCDFPVYSLGSPALIPEAVLAQIVNDTAPTAQIHRADGGAIAAFDGARLVALVNQTTGETKVFPSLDALVPAGANGIDVGLVARQYLANEQIFPRDDTNFTVVPGASLLGATHDNGTAPTASQTYLTHAWVRRNITVGDSHYPVCGPGSKASFGVGADGSVRSVSHRWKPATHSGRTVSSVSPDEVYAAIQRQLGGCNAGSGDVHVHMVEICFYDSGDSFIQPVYRFGATIGPSVAGDRNASTAGITGYVPLGDSPVEPIPDLTQRVPRQQPAEPTVQGSPTTTCSTPESHRTPTAGWPQHSDGPHEPYGSQQSDVPHGSQPSQAPYGSQPSQGAWPSHRPHLKERQLFGPQIKVGRYIDRNDPNVNPGYTQWYDNSWAFLDGLYLSQAFPFSLFPKVEFIDSQYLWAYPDMFTSLKDSYVNTVHIADTEVHGNWHIFWTLYNTGDTVSLESDIPSSGYGPGADGDLAYWILHSCEVIPAVMDFSAANVNNAWDTWFSIFNGMHAAVGYRTEMWIDDGVTGPFGAAIGSGAAVVSSWMNIVHDDTAHYIPVSLDNENPNGIEEPLGRPAAVAVCGHADDTVTMVDDIGRPGCLQMWWYDNSY